MKTNRFVLCLRGLALLALFIVVPARAADGFYFGATGMLASSGAPGFDDAINAGAYGYVLSSRYNMREVAREIVI